MHRYASDFVLSHNEGEIGYWIGVPFWGQALIPEAVNEILRYGFEKLDLKKMWFYIPQLIRCYLILERGT